MMASAKIQSAYLSSPSRCWSISPQRLQLYAQEQSVRPGHYQAGTELRSSKTPAMTLGGTISSMGSQNIGAGVSVTGAVAMILYGLRKGRSFSRRKLVWATPLRGSALWAGAASCLAQKY